jgi:hypothetical protein
LVIAACIARIPSACTPCSRSPCLGLLCFDCPHRFQVGLIRLSLELLRTGRLSHWQRAAAGSWLEAPWWHLWHVALGWPTAWCGRLGLGLHRKLGLQRLWRL